VADAEAVQERHAPADALQVERAAQAHEAAADDDGRFAHVV
jgi:hypothetical protein